jgi:hypothetical protein
MAALHAHDFWRMARDGCATSFGWQVCGGVGTASRSLRDSRSKLTEAGSALAMVEEFGSWRRSNDVRHWRYGQDHAPGASTW